MLFYEQIVNLRDPKILGKFTLCSQLQVYKLFSLCSYFVHKFGPAPASTARPRSHFVHILFTIGSKCQKAP